MSVGYQAQFDYPAAKDFFRSANSKIKNPDSQNSYEAYIITRALEMEKQGYKPENLNSNRRIKIFNMVTAGMLDYENGKLYITQRGRERYENIYKMVSQSDRAYSPRGLFIRDNPQSKSI